MEGDAEGEDADEGVKVFVADEAIDFGGLKQVWCVWCAYECEAVCALKKCVCLSVWRV